MVSSKASLSQSPVLHFRLSRSLLKVSLKKLLVHRAVALLGAVLLLGAVSASAQMVGADEPRSGSQRGDFGSPEAEMLRRAEIRREEETHKEMVERADEVVQIGDALLASFKKNNSITRDDVKRLERLEKLARKIRGGAGGSDDENELSDPPNQVEGAVTRLSKLACSLKESVSKSSRLVVSGNVIERSNEIIELIRHIRTFKLP